MKWRTALQLIQDVALTGTGLAIIWLQIWAPSPNAVLLVVALALTTPSVKSHATAILSGPGAPSSSESSPADGGQPSPPSPSSPSE